MMMKSQLHQQYQASYSEAYGFDLRQDFSQYLEEAKRHENEAKRSSLVHPEESVITGSKKEKKVKKSWKSSLISWWKGDKKSKVRGEPTNNSKSKVSGQRKGQVSGPIYNSGKGIDVKKHQRGSTSGPLTSLFKSKKREECEIPYMSLHQQNNPSPVHNFGPLYVVT